MEKSFDGEFDIGELKILKSCSEDLQRRFIKKILGDFFLGRIDEDEKYVHYVIYDMQFFKNKNFTSPIDTSRMNFNNIEKII